MYSYKTFTLTADTLVKRNRLSKLLPRAWIRYLVGYILINQFRIWLPIVNKVIIIKDIHFNKEYIFNGKFKTLQENIKIIEPGLLQEVLKKAAKRDMEN